MSDMFSSAEVADLIGYTQRTVIKKAAAGEIPGAYKFFDEWRFDKAKVRRWMRDKLQGVPSWRPSINEPKRQKSGGAASSATGRSTESLYEQMINGSPKSGLTNGLQK